MMAAVTDITNGHDNKPNSSDQKEIPKTMEVDKVEQTKNEKDKSSVTVNGTNGDAKTNGHTTAKDTIKATTTVKSQNGTKKRRQRKQSLEDDLEIPVGKRVRLQHQPFQSPAVKTLVPQFFRPTNHAPAKNGEQDDRIVVFNKGDFLAVRNELNGFYICRTAQNVYKNSRKFKIQWLNDDKDHYTPDFFDQTDFECVLTNLRMIRTGKGKYELPEDERKRATNILQRALNVEKGVSEIPDPRSVAMDGVDVSMLGKAEEEELFQLVREVVEQPKPKPSRRESSEASKTTKSSNKETKEVEKEEKLEKVVSKTKIAKVNSKKLKKSKANLKRDRPVLRPRGQPVEVEKKATKAVEPEKASIPKTLPGRRSTEIKKVEELPEEKPKPKKSVGRKPSISTEVKKPIEKKEKPVKQVIVTPPSKPAQPVIKEIRTPIAGNILADLTGIVYKSTSHNEHSITKSNTRSILSAINANPSQVRLMIADDINVLEKDEMGNTFVHLLCKMSKKPEKTLDILNDLLKHEPKLSEITNKDGRTALHLAVSSCISEIDLKVVDCLLNAGFNRLAQDKLCRIPLHYLFVKIDREEDNSFSDPVELTILLTCGHKESVNHADSNGQTPLHRAAQRGATFSVTQLIRCSRDKIDALDHYSNSPLAIAIKSGHEYCSFSMMLLGCNYGMTLHTPRTIKEDNHSWRWIHSINEQSNNEKSSIILEVMKRKWNRLIHLLLEMLQDVGQELSHALAAAIKCQNLKLALKIAKRMKDESVETSTNQKNFIHLLSQIVVNDENREQLLRLMEYLLEHSIAKLDDVDENQSNALISAALHHNWLFCEELTKKITISGIPNLPLDRYLRSPLTALFCRMGTEDIDGKLQAWGSRLTAAKMSVDGPCIFPVKESIYPNVRFVHDDCGDGIKYSPLIFSIIKRNFHEVRYLMSQKADVNMPDELGRTPLMHAVRLNDIKMVKALLTSRYEPDTDSNPWSSRFLTFKKTTSADLSVVDKDGNSVLHHVVAPLPEFTYSISDVLVRLLASAGAPLDILNAAGLSPLQVAIQRKAEKLIQTLKDLLPEDKHPPEIANGSNGDIDSSVEPESPNFDEDSACFISVVASKDTVEQLKVMADKLLGFGDSSEVLFDDAQGVPYSVLLIKADKEVWGVCHFYKLQIVIHKQRNLVVLFTHSGQVGQAGQHSKETYSKKSDAIDEFAKIFKTKTGNSWTSLDKFVPVPKKFRLVKMSVKTSDLRSQLEEINPETSTKVSSEVCQLINGVVKSMMDRENEEDLDCISGVKLISDDMVTKSEEILLNIGILIAEKEKEIKAMKTDKKSTSSNPKIVKILDQIIDLSDELYNLIPIPVKLRLTPVLDESQFKSKNDLLRSIRNRILTGKLILGSYFKRSTYNQLDYIYDCLKCQINILDKNSSECQLLLQYIHNSSLPSSRPQVERIFRVCKKSQETQLKKCDVNNRWLLFHSAPTQDLLPVLARGLQITSSDTFLKGIAFCDSVSAINSPKYVLVCEVALGKVEEKSGGLMEPSPGFSSMKTKSPRWQPDPIGSVYWKGRTVPVGPLIESDSSEVSGEFNQFVVCDRSQVCIRYLIQMSS